MSDQCPSSKRDEYCPILSDPAMKVGYPCGENDPDYLKGPVTDINSSDFNIKFSARNREWTLCKFKEYVDHYESSWAPFDTQQCPPVRLPEPKKESEKEPRAYVAINSVRLKIPKGLDRKSLFEMMRMVSSHMCMATAGNPGFLGYDIIIQTGSCPAMLRWAVDAEYLTDDSEFWMDQYTVWRSYKDHENFHGIFEDVVMESCMHCGMVMTEGPYESIYCVLDRHLPRAITSSSYMKILTDPLRTNGTPDEKAKAEKKVKGYAVDTGDIHNVQMFFDVTPGYEERFEKYINQTFTTLKQTGHCLGYTVLRQLGYNPAGSANYTIKSMYWEMMDRSGIRQLEETATLNETFLIQPKYLIRSDWISPEAIKMYLSQVHTDRRNLFPFALGVLDSCYTRPNVRISKPHKSDYRWLEYLNGTMTPSYAPEGQPNCAGYQIDNMANLPFTPDLCRDKWYGFFGYKTNDKTGHYEVRDPNSPCGRLIPVDAKDILPTLPGDSSVACQPKASPVSGINTMFSPKKGQCKPCGY